MYYFESLTNYLNYLINYLNCCVSNHVSPEGSKEQIEFKFLVDYYRGIIYSNSEID